MRDDNTIVLVPQYIINYMDSAYEDAVRLLLRFCGKVADAPRDASPMGWYSTYSHMMEEGMREISGIRGVLRLARQSLFDESDTTWIAVDKHGKRIAELIHEARIDMLAIALNPEDYVDEPEEEEAAA